MKQRGRASGQPVKGRSGSATGPKARKAPTAHVSNADLQEQLDRAMRERDEALEQQTATSEVLQVISRSAGELQPVFDIILENAVRICGAKFGSLLLVEGDAYRNVALYGAPQAFLEERRRNPIIRPRPGSALDRVRTTKQIIHIADMQVGGPPPPQSSNWPARAPSSTFRC